MTKKTAVDIPHEKKDSPHPVKAESNRRPEEKAADVIGGKMRKLDKVAAPTNYKEYVTRLPDLERYLDKFRIGFAASLQEAERQAKGTKIEQNMRRLAENFSMYFEEILFKLMMKINLANDPILMKRILAGTYPVVLIKSLEKGRGGEESEYVEEGQPIIVISPDSDFNSSYEGLRATLTHEFGHAFVQSMTMSRIRNRHLTEGVTEFLASQVLAEKPRAYENDVELASAIFSADSTALLELYAGGISDKEFVERITDDLRSNSTDAEATGIAHKVIGLDHDITKMDITFSDALRAHAGPLLKRSREDEFNIERPYEILTLSIKNYPNPPSQENLTLIRAMLKKPDDAQKIVVDTRSMWAAHNRKKSEYYQELASKFRFSRAPNF